MAGVTEVDSFTTDDEREALLSSRLASLNLPDHASMGSPMPSGRRGGGASPEPYALSSTMQAALQVAETKKREDDLRAREAHLAQMGGGCGTPNQRALTERTVALSSRLRENEEVAESLRQRERVLEQKLREKRSTEAALMRRVDQLQTRLMEVEANATSSAEEAGHLRDQLAAAKDEAARVTADYKDAVSRLRKLEFQTKQQDEQVKALANRVKQESMDKAARWKEYSVVERAMQDRLRGKEAEEFRLMEKVRAMETKLEMQNVKLSEMVAREQALLAQVDEYRAAEQQMADGVRGAEVRSKALADSLVEKEASEEELLEKLRQMEMRNGTLQLLLERSEKLHASLKENEGRLKAELHEKTEAEAAALHQATLYDTERRLRARQVDDLSKQLAAAEQAVADHEEIVSSLRAGKDTVEAELQTEASKSASLAARITELQAALTARDDELEQVRATINDEARRATDAETALVRAERSQVSVVEKEKKLMDEVKSAQMAALAAKKRGEALKAQIQELKQSEAELATGLNTLGQALNTKDQTIEQLEGELRRVRDAASSSSEALTMKAAVVADLNTKLAGSVSRHKTLQALLWRQEKVEATMREREKLLEKQLAESRAAADTLSQNVRELTARVREIQDNEAKLEETTRSQLSRNERLVQERDAARATVAKLQAKAAAAETTEAGLRESVAQLEARGVEAGATADALRAEVATWQDRATEAEEKVAQLEADAVELADRLMRHDKDANKARATLWRSQQSASSLTTRAEVQAKQLRDAQQRCLVLTTQTEGLQLQLHRSREQAERAAAEVAHKLDRANLTNQELTAALRQRERTEAVLSSQIEDLNAAIRRHEAENTVLAQRNKQLEATLSDKERSETTLLANADRLDKELTAVMRQRAQLQARLERATTEAKDQAGRAAALEERHEELNATLKEKVHREAVLSERHKHMASQLAAAKSAESELKRRMDKLASPRGAVRAIKNVASAANAFASATARGAERPRTPGSPSTGSAAPRSGGLFHLAYSHPSRTAQRYAVYRSIFDAVDKDRSGTISLAELKAYVESTATRSGYLEAKRRQGAPHKNLDSDALLGVSAATGGGDGAAEEKHAGGIGGVHAPDTPRSRSRGAQVVDAHTRSRFCRFFTAGRGGLDATFSKYDTDGNGTISWEEFKVLADEVFLPTGLGTALAGEEKRAAKAEARRNRATSQEAEKELAEWRLVEKTRQQRVLADELERQNQRLLAAAKDGRLGDAVFGAATPERGIGGQRSGPPPSSTMGTPARGVPRMQLLQSGDSGADASPVTNGTASSGDVVLSSPPPRRIAATAASPLGTSYASPAKGVGFGETGLITGGGGQYTPPPRTAPGRAIMDSSGNLTVPMLAGDAPLVISPHGSPLGATPPPAPAKDGSSSALRLPQLPASVAKYLSPAAMKHVQVGPAGDSDVPRAAPSVDGATSVATSVDGSEMGDLAGVEAASVSVAPSDDEHEQLMASLDKREQEMEASMGGMEESFVTLHKRDEELQALLARAQASNAAHDVDAS